MVVLALTVGCLLPASPSRAELLWVARADGVLKVQAQSGKVLLTLPSTPPVEAVAVDAQRRRVWIVAGGELASYDLAGHRQASVPLLGGGSGHSQVVIDESDGSALVNESDRIERIAPDGAIVWSRALLEPSRLVDSGEGRVWLVTADGLEKIDLPSGDTTERIPAVSGARAIGICPGPSVGATWLATSAEVELLRGQRSSPAKRFEIPQLQQARCDGTGGVWLATASELLHFLPDRPAPIRVRPFAGVGTIVDLAINLEDHSLWVANEVDLARVSLTGSVVQRIALQPPALIVGLAVQARPFRERKPDAKSAGKPSDSGNAGPTAALTPLIQLAGMQTQVRGTIVWPNGRPVAGVSVTAFGSSVAVATSAADGAFLTPALSADANQNVKVVAKGTLAAGAVRATTISVPVTGALTDVGNLTVDFVCPAAFASGLFPANALNGEVRAITVFDNGTGPALYVAGAFTTAGGVTVNRVARWNGSQWSALGSGLSGGTSPAVNALLVFDDGTGTKLYAGGNFTTSGTTAVKHVAKWTGTAWAPVGAGLASQVYALASYDAGSGASLYAAGTFTTVGTTNFNRIARWTGTAWTTVGTGLNSTVKALLAHNDGTGNKLYVGGQFTTAGGAAANRIARWTGTAWQALGTGVSGGTTPLVNALTTWDDGTGLALYAGGTFTTAGSVTVNHVARWKSAAWSALGSGSGSAVRALATYDDGRGAALYVGGTFTTVSSIAYNRLARWDGVSWSRLSTGANGNVLALQPSTVGGGAALYAGGAFTTAGGLASSRMARWSRPASCTDTTAPLLYFVAPDDGAVLATRTPTLVFGFDEAGSGINLSTLALTANGVSVPLSCSTSGESASCLPQQPLLEGTLSLQATVRDLAGNLSAPAVRTITIPDATPPTLTITSPAQGAVVPTAYPGLGFSYSDSGTGVDTASLAIQVNGSAIGLECQTQAASALCVPTSPLPNGAVSVAATVRDFQGNLSDVASRSFTVDAAAGAHTTTVRGVVRFENGANAVGAGITLGIDPFQTTTTAADGTFELPAVPVESGSRLSLKAVGAPPDNPKVASRDGIVPVLDGVTDLGVITLRAACDYFAASSPFLPTDVALVGAYLDGWKAAVAFDDGQGPALYIGGDFPLAGNRRVNRVAKWTANGWSPLGAGFTGTQKAEVDALAVFDDGSGAALFAGGDFTKSGYSAVEYLAKWTPSGWVEAGRGTNGIVRGLATFDDGTGSALYVAGGFTQVNHGTDWNGTSVAVAANYVARWNGQAWSQVGSGLPGAAYGLWVLNDGTGSALYATTWIAGGEIWKWAGGTWAQVFSDLDSVSTLAQLDTGSGPSLYAGGYFGLKKKVGASWTTVLSNTSSVSSLAPLGQGAGAKLLVSGNFSLAGFDPYTRTLASWNGTAWSSPLGEGPMLFAVSGLGPQPTVYGGLAGPGTYDITPATWTGTSWAPLQPQGDTVGAITSVAVFGDASGDAIYFAGPTRAGGVTLNGGIARWDGTTVVPMGQGLPTGGTAVFVLDDGNGRSLYALDGPNGTVARWTGSQWQLMGSAIGVTINALVVANVAGAGPRLFAGGNGLYRWNGAFWAPLGGPSSIQALAGYGGQIYASGSLLLVGGAWANNIARWDGSVWSSLGSGTTNGVDGPVYALATFQDQLHVGGYFYRAGGADHYSYVAWNGSSWNSGVIGGCGLLRNEFISGTGVFTGTVRSLAVFDDGVAQQLVLGGQFRVRCDSSGGGTTYASFLPYENLNLGAGVTGPPVNALATGSFKGGPTVVAGGAFNDLAGQLSGKLALWYASPGAAECSPTQQPPVLTVTSPIDGSFTNAASVTVAGFVDEPATLTLDGQPLTLAADRTFSSSPILLSAGARTFTVTATDRRGSPTSVHTTVTRDATPPTVAFRSPAAGTTVYSDHPVLDLTLGDDVSGIDPASFALIVSSTQLPPSACLVTATAARCTVPTALADGPATASATVRDRAGNLSAPASLAFQVSHVTGAAQTTIQGTVHRADGSAATGARLRVLGIAGATSTAAADGSFTIVGVTIASNQPLTVVAELSTPSGVLLGLARNLTPVPGGVTNAGVITLGSSSCELGFAEGLFGGVGVSGRVLALAVFDDGSGPALYVGGSFASAGGVTAANIARWDGTRWSALGGGTNGAVRALAVFDGGSGPTLFVGGSFSWVDGQTIGGLAKWNGQAWSPAGGSGVATRVYSIYSGTCVPGPGTVYSLLVFDDGQGPALYVGGNFYSVNGVASDYVARWNGSQWGALAASSVCPINPPAVMTMAAYDDGAGRKLYAGGNFTALAGVAASRIAKWTGSAWSPLQTGVGRTTSNSDDSLGVYSLAVYDAGAGPELYAGGLFTVAGNLDLSVSSIARWNGQRWAAVGSGLEVNYAQVGSPMAHGIQALSVFDDGTGPALYATGAFSGATRNDLTAIARWNGTQWQGVGRGLSDQGYGGATMAVFGGELFVGGGFDRAEGIGVNRLARWNGARWRGAGEGFDGPVEALTLFDDGTGPALIAGGGFTTIRGRAAQHLARWDGQSWFPLGAGTDAAVHALRSFDDGSGPGLFATGDFTLAGNLPASRIAKWNGRDWSALGAGLDAPGRALEVFDDGGGQGLFVGGDFAIAGGAAASRVARWRGGLWSPLGSGILGASGVGGSVHALTVSSVGGLPALYAGGTFATAGGTAAASIARWNGASWSAMGSGPGGNVEALLDLKTGPTPGLIAGGAFGQARWTGSAWAPFSFYLQPTVFALAEWDDGSGMPLHLGGSFVSSVAGAVLHGLARQSTGDFQSLGGGVLGGSVLTLLPYDEADGSGLYVGGSFTSAGGATSVSLARWYRPLDCRDRTAPTIAFTSPAADAFVASAQPPLVLALSDNQSGVDPASLAITRNGSALPVSCATDATTATCTPASALPEGASTIAATAQDFAGNPSAPAQVAFTVDTVAPTVTFTSPSNGAIVASSTPTIYLAYSDATSGAAPQTLSIVLSGAPGIGLDCSLGASTADCVPSPPLADGSYAFVATIRDRAGNLSPEAGLSLTVDTAPPTLQIVMPIDGSFLQNPSPEIQVAFSDAGAGVDSTTLSFSFAGTPLAVDCTTSAGGAVCAPRNPLPPGDGLLEAVIDDRAGRASAPALAQLHVAAQNEPFPLTVSSPTEDTYTAAGSVTVSGATVVPATVTVNGAPVSLQPDGTFAHGPVPIIEGPNSILVRAAYPAGYFVEVKRRVNGDTVQPRLWFQAPLDTAVFDPSTQPVELFVTGTGSPIDTSSFTLTANGTAIAGSCTFCPLSIRCTIPVVPGPVITLVASVQDMAGLSSGPVTVRYVTDSGVDIVPPAITISFPPDGYRTAAASVSIYGLLSEPATVQANSEPVPVDTDLRFLIASFPLTEGANPISITAVDAAGNASEHQLTVVRDSIAPPPVVVGAISVGAVSAGHSQVTGAAGSIPIAELPAMARITNLETGGTADAPFDGSGGFSSLVPCEGGDRITIAVLDGAGNASAERIFVVPGSPAAVPDPAPVAPPLDPTLPTDPCVAASFLVSQGIQRGTQSGAIECPHIAVARGRVLDRSGAPLANVRVGVREHPEVGWTLTRADGRFDLLCDGGRPLTLRLAASGYLPAERPFEAGWGETHTVQDVVLVQIDGISNAIDLSAGSGQQVARGALASDADGDRRATLLFPSGTQATLRYALGGAEPLTTPATVRLTEFTIGSTGPAAMPAALPPASAYTYAVDLRVDEATAAGAAAVELSQPIPFYVENFLHLPVGTRIPVAYYDFSEHRWISQETARIVKVLSIGGGLAELDVAGAGVAASPAELAELGVADAERQKLAELYGVGQELWRARMAHFSVYDLNLPAKTSGSTPPNQKSPASDADKKLDKPNCANGSIIECENQILGEAIPITGTPFALHYTSDRVPGRKAANRLDIPLTGAAPPAGLTRVDLEVEVAGQKVTQAFSPTASAATSFDWDGLDAYGRPAQGSQPYEVRIGYTYTAEYGNPPASCGLACFGLPPSGPITGNLTRQEVTYWQSHTGRVGVFDALRSLAMGGWSISPHHVYDPHEGILYLGDGRRVRPRDVQTVQAVVGTGVFGSGGDGGPAARATIASPDDIEPSPTKQGGYYFIDFDNCRVRFVDAAGTIRTVAGTRCPDILEHPAPGDGLLATQVFLDHPKGIGAAPDGSLYIAETGRSVIRKVAPDGRISTVAGYSYPAMGGPAGNTPATSRLLVYPQDVAVGPDGDIYFNYGGGWAGPETYGSDVIYRVDPRAGSIATYAGGGTAEWSCTSFEPFGVNGLATEAFFPSVSSIVFDRQGNLVFADDQANAVYRVSLSGRLEGIAGGWRLDSCDGDGTLHMTAWGYQGDGSSARDAMLHAPSAIAVGSDGSVFIADQANHAIRRVGPAGIITTVAGTGQAGYNGLQQPAARTQLASPYGISARRDGSLLIADTGNNRVRRVENILPGSGSTGTQEIRIPSEDGSLRYVFDPSGRHLHTDNAATGQVLLTFGYDSEGRLVSITDAFTNITTIERNLAGEATAIAAPFGQRTVLGPLTQSGYLAAVDGPGAEHFAMTYSDDGLLLTFVDPKGHPSTMTYDALGRLEQDTDRAAGHKALVRTEDGDTTTVTETTAMGRVTTYRTEKLSTGGERRTVIRPDGTTTVTTRKSDGSTTTTAGDGSIATSQQAPDPRFGLRAPIVSNVDARLPSGLTSTATASREVTLVDPAADPEEPDSVATLHDVATVNGRTLQSVYTAATRELVTTSPEGRSGRTRFDLFGRALETESPAILPVTRTYDARGRLATVTQGSRTTTYTYNAAGLLDTIRDPLQREVQLLYDSRGRVTRQRLPDFRDIAFDYDENGNLTSLTPPGRPAHGFDYTLVDQPRESAPPDVGLPERRTLWAYNLDHQLELVTRPDGQTIDPVYGAANGRLESVVTPRGTFSYTYAPTSGNLTAISDPDGGNLGFAYDGSLPTSVTWTGAVAGSVGFVYNSSFEVTRRLVNDANPIDLAYDDDGLLAAAGDLALSRSTLSGFLTGTSLGTTTDSRTYTSYGELDTYAATAGGNAALAYDLDRDAGGRITKKTETIGGVTAVWEYHYDTAGRLDEVKRDGAVVESYGYDTNSNRTSWTDFWGTGAATYDAQDRLLTAAGRSYTYTANGELTTKTAGPETTTYGYDVLGNLRTVTLPTGVAIEYLIDAANRRVGKKVNGTLVQGFLWQSALQPAAELDGNGNVVSLFVYGTKPNVPDYLVKGGNTFRIFTDHLGSVRLVVKTTDNTIAQRIDYDAFGRVMLDTNPGFQPFGFAGGLYDSQTGLTRFGARDFDPETGRWTTKDPIGFAGSDINLYGYVLSDPINSTDVSGLYDAEDFADDALHFMAGAADSFLLDLGDNLRRAAGNDNVDRCSTAYKIGHGVAEVAGFLRLGYAVTAKALGHYWLKAVAEGAGPAAIAATAVEGRNMLKTAFRGGLFPGFHRRTLEYMLERHRGDVMKVIESSGKTNRGLNSLGASSVASGAFGQSDCECN